VTFFLQRNTEIKLLFVFLIFYIRMAHLRLFTVFVPVPILWNWAIITTKTQILDTYNTILRHSILG
jgi:hypothetical protein